MVDQNNITPHLLSFLEQGKIHITTEINTYTNKDNNLCVNEVEIKEHLSRGLVWSVSKANRYYINDDKEIEKEEFVIKKAHIRSLKSMRYFEDDEQKNYFDRIIVELKIHEMFFDDKEIGKLYKVFYDPSSEIYNNASKNNQYIYCLMELYQLGPLMIRNTDDSKYYHNYEILKAFISKFSLDYSFENDKFKQDNEDSCSNFYIKTAPKYELILQMAKFFFPQIVLALKKLHSKNVAYNDIKPENLCLDSNLNVKALDFGVSSIDRNEINLMGGTTGFQPPESYLGKFNPFKGDFFSLGVTFYIFLTSELPWDGDSELVIQMKTMKGKVTFPTYVGESEKTLITNLLEIDPLKRNTSFDLVMKHLDSFN